MIDWVIDESVKFDRNICFSEDLFHRIVAKVGKVSCQVGNPTVGVANFLFSNINNTF